jgi:1,4-dihydroxy-2-naphthoate octaprenyltransferase
METAASPGLKVWLMAARPKTLGAAVAPVVLGTALALDAGALHLPAALCALLGAVLIQVGVNYHNDYVDFERGTDTEARVGPTRVTQAGWVTPAAMRRATVGVFAAAVLAGGYLIVRGGWPILLVGVASIASALAYTAGRYSLAYTGLADLFVFVFFGPVAVAGTYYVQALTLPVVPVVAGAGPGFLAVAILLVNNVRDVEGDRTAHKMTLVVRLGRRAGVALYAGCLVGAAAVPVALWAWTGSHAGALAAALVPAGGVPLARRLATEHDPRALNPLLGATGRLLVLYALCFAVGWNV